MRLRKLILTIILAFALVLNTVSLGYSLASSQLSTIITYGLKTTFFVYLFLLSARSIKQSTSKLHADSIQHISSLLCLSTFLLFCTAIFPDRPAQASQPKNKALDGVWYSILVLDIFAWILAFDIPQGPSLHYPCSLIYSEKIIEKTTNKECGNVCGVVGLYSKLALISVRRLRDLFL